MTQSGEDRLLTFEIGEALFAMPIAGVLEVTERGVEACVPTVSSCVASVINYRGDALPVVRRERLLELGDAEPSRPDRRRGRDLPRLRTGGGAPADRRPARSHLGSGAAGCARSGSDRKLAREERVKQRGE